MKYLAKVKGVAKGSIAEEAGIEKTHMDRFPADDDPADRLHRPGRQQ